MSKQKVAAPGRARAAPGGAGLAPKLRHRLVGAVLVAAACLTSIPLTAAPIQGVDSLRSTVEAHLASLPRTGRGEVRIKVGAIDPRLRLPLCTHPPEASIPDGGRSAGQVTVGVRCERPAWSLYVPARVEIRERVLVANRGLSRGAVLAEGDLALAERDVASQSGGYFTDVAAAVGKSLRRPVQSGTVLGPALLEEPPVVRRGDRVTLVARAEGVEVRMEGEALSAAGRGEPVRVRNLSSRREVQGIASGPGTVDVRL